MNYKRKNQTNKLKVSVFFILLFLGTNMNADIKKAREEASTAVLLQNTFIKVKGIVTDEKGEPLIGVTILDVNNSKNITATDLNGKFEIRVRNTASKLKFIYVGYEDLTLPIEKEHDLNNLKVILKSSQKELEEVVVVGYGTQKKISLTGAVSSINSTSLKQTPVANLSNALAGKIPGLMAIQSSGEPGYDGSNLWIRGIGTYNGTQSPLILVDGIERSFSNIDPNEIENISILKDASATAVYGVRGANGVILVTTKRGQIGKPQVSINLQQGSQVPTRLAKYLDAYDALTLYEEGLANDGLASRYSKETIAKYNDRSNPTYQYLYPNVDWTKELIKDATGMGQANINIQGGNELSKYFVSIGYLNQDGIYKHTNLSNYNVNARTQRYNFRSNIDLTIKKDVKITLNLGGIIQDNNYPGNSASTLFYAIRTRPSWYYPMTNPDGSIAEKLNSEANPYALLTQTGYYAGKSTSLTATTGVTWDLGTLVTKGLSLTGRLSFDAMNYRNVARYKGYKSYIFSIDENETDLTKGTYTAVSTASEQLGYSVYAGGTRYTVLELLANYDRSFGKHNLGGLLLYNQSSNSADASDAISGLPYRKQGIVGRVTYNYNSKYFAEFDAGYNGSENFPKGKRFGFFPALSGSWVLSSEDFLKDLTFLDLLKLRASYGLVGNDQIGGSRFLYQSTWVTNWAGYAFGPTGNGLYLGGAGVNSTGNPDVTWEKSRKLNIGLDIDLLKKAIHFSLDVFHEKRSDILTSPLTIPSTVGIVSLPYINGGIVTNKGFEVEWGHELNFRNWGYFIRGNFSYATDRIDQMLEPENKTKPWQRQTGRHIGEQYGYIAEGLFQTQAEINDPSIPKMAGITLQPGDIKYKDLNGDGVINSDDECYLGKLSQPDKIFGISLGGHYKNADFSILFQGATGGTTYFTGATVWPFFSKASVLAEVKNNYWSINNTAEQNLHVYFPRLSSDYNSNNMVNSTYWLKSSDYLRLKNAEIGYNIPKNILKYADFETARIYINGLNLITWDHLKIFDPESPSGFTNYPQMKVFNIGLSITF